MNRCTRCGKAVFEGHTDGENYLYCDRCEDDYREEHAVFVAEHMSCVVCGAPLSEYHLAAIGRICTVCESQAEWMSDLDARLARDGFRVMRHPEADRYLVVQRGHEEDPLWSDADEVAAYTWAERHLLPSSEPITAEEVAAWKARLIEIMRRV